MRVRSWPRKRGPSKSPEVRRQVEWFKQANHIAKRVAPTQQALAIAMTKGTGLYPRDLLLRQMSGGIYDIIDEDGVNYQTRQAFTETVMFQGTILEKTATQSLPGGTTTLLTWPLPVLDTAGFWNAGTPERLTIPAGVNVVALNGGFGATASKTNIVTAPNLRKNGAVRAVLATRITGNAAGTWSTGPLTVIAGDFFEFFIFTSIAFLTVGDFQTFFNITILDAD